MCKLLVQVGSHLCSHSLTPVSEGVPLCKTCALHSVQEPSLQELCTAHCARTLCARTVQEASLQEQLCNSHHFCISQMQKKESLPAMTIFRCASISCFQAESN